MTIRNTYAAEAWDKIYNAFQQINFTAYDYDTVKESLLQYLKIYHSEHFNDFIESGELVANIEAFAYVAEQLAYRIDVMSHENFMSTAQRKQSILRLARLISYRASRNIPARGLVKLTSVRTSEQIFDSLGNDLSNVTVTWNDPNNSNWKEQFFLVMNKSLTTKFGQPQKSFQIGDVTMQLYTFNNNASSFKNGVYTFSVGGTNETLPAEITPADIDETGPFERSPDLNAQMSLIYAVDGRGDGSDYTGFLMFMKQGTLLRTDYTILEPTENRRIELDAININDTDVWVYRVDDEGRIIENWSMVETLNEQNLVFNSDSSSRKKFEAETLENDRIALIFGDGNFSDAPVGNFQIWTRVSTNSNVTIPKNQVVNQKLSFNYSTQQNSTQTLAATFSLTSALQNNSASETTEHIRQAAPATYYAQNRMVNGQDYNTYPLKDQSILKLKTINRTFAGQPKYIEWNDASGAYQNVKLFGDDLLMYYDINANSVETTGSSRSLIDGVLEPLLQETGVFNILNHISATHELGYGVISNPRRKFMEDNRPVFFDGLTGEATNPYGPVAPSANDATLREKTAIQGALDRHWYGEPKSYVTIDGIRHGVISDPTTADAADDGNLYDEGLKRTIDGENTWPPGDIGSGLQTFLTNQQFFGVRFNRFLKAFGNGDIALSSVASGVDAFNDRVEVFTIEVQSDKTTLSVVSNIRGRLADGRINSQYAEVNDTTQPIDFLITQGDVAFEAGDAFVVDLRWTSTGWVPTTRLFNGETKVNLNGWFELIRADDLTDIDPTDSVKWARAAVDFDPSDSAKSWVFIIKRENDANGNPLSFTVWYRDMRLVVESPTTKFWFNQSAQIIDAETLKPVYDKIRILRSNLDGKNRPLMANDIYDVVGFVYDKDGNIVTSKLEVLPSDSINFTKSGDGLPDNILQFENFSTDSYQFGRFDYDANNVEWMTCGTYRYVGNYDTTVYEKEGYDSGRLEVLDSTGVVVETFVFKSGNFLSEQHEGSMIFRRRLMPAPCSGSGLDFMWQHFTPSANLIDPSVTNIHDAFILTRGYYDSMIDFVKGVSTVEPTPPTPLDLRTSYGELLKNKMLSDTLVLHSGKIKLLFGSMADAQLRAKFRVVKAPGATFSNERIKTEIISVIDSYFDIGNWDFGDKFYATELISLIHQRLPTQIASVVLVPSYSVNSFGSLFTIDSGFDEILQSCATVNDVEIVDALTPSVLRQIR
jgi:hypothetical protein